IAIHHSLTLSGSAEAFANYHVNTHDWPGIGYHFVIEKNGTVVWCHNPGTLSYHVGNSNKHAIGICLTGDFRVQEPTDAQKESLRVLVSALKKDMPNYVATKGHSEFPGYSWKACPCFDYKSVLSAVTQPQMPDSKKANELHYWAKLLHRDGLEGSGLWGYNNLRAFFNATGRNAKKLYDPNQVAYLKTLEKQGGGTAAWAKKELQKYIDTNQILYAATLLHEGNEGQKTWAFKALPNYL
ncbi:N-acetylmuramoyl-L-alanine amidase, partial [Bacillaceae bacterium SIJ1]|uniref:peptidoglycan recognition protein family protein n=1 Tax=Litoribacterium kuwaitense TaxID=1398745 RepID=UPI0013EC4899